MEKMARKEGKDERRGAAEDRKPNKYRENSRKSRTGSREVQERGGEGESGAGDETKQARKEEGNGETLGDAQMGGGLHREEQRLLGEEEERID